MKALKEDNPPCHPTCPEQQPHKENQSLQLLPTHVAPSRIVTKATMTGISLLCRIQGLQTQEG